MAEVVLKVILEGAQQAETGIEGVSKAYSEVGEASKKAGEEQKKVFKETTKNGQILNESFKGLKGSIINAFAGVATISAISAFARASISAFSEAEVNANKLRFAIKNIAGESTEAFDKLIEQSEQLQEISIFSDDDIQKAQTQLAQFGLMSDEIEKLTPLIVDLASAQGIDLASATDKVISGINGQSRALKDAGVEFEDTGDKTANLSILMGQLDKFTGSAAVSLDTAAGRAANFSNSVDNIKEVVGQFLVDSGDAFLDFLDSVFDPIGNAAEKAISQAAKEIKSRNDAILAGLKDLSKQQLEERVKLNEDLLKQVIKGRFKISESEKNSYLAEIELAEKLIKQKNDIEENARLANANKNLEINKKKIEDEKKQQEQADKERIKAIKQQAKDEENARLESNKKIAEETEKKYKENRERILKNGRDLIKSTIHDEEEAEEEKYTIRATFAKLGLELTDQQFTATQQFYANLKVIAQDNAEAMKAFATAEALVNTYLGASQALGALPPPFSFIAAAAAVAAGLLNVAKIQGIQFAHGGYTGDGGKYQEAGTVHKGEFVTTKEKTAQHRGLLEAIHNDKAPSIADITGLLKGTGVVLMPEVAGRMSSELNNSHNQKLYQQQQSDKNIEELNNNFKKWMSEQGKNSDKTMADGTRIIKSGNTIRKITKRRI